MPLVGTPRELFERPAHTFVCDFIGLPGMNVFGAEIDGTTARIEGSQVALGAGYRPTPGEVQVGGAEAP